MTRHLTTLAALLVVLAFGACGTDDDSGPPGADTVGTDARTDVPSSTVDVPRPGDAPPGADLPSGTDVAGPADVASVDVPRPGVDLGPRPDAPSNHAPTFDALPAVTVEMAAVTVLDLRPFFADDEDADEALTLEWSAQHVALADEGTHVLVIVGPTDWSGTEVVPITVRDTGGLAATSELSVTVTEVEPPGPVDPPGPNPDPDECGRTTFRYAAGGGAHEVLLSGTFNGWGGDVATATPLEDPDGDGIFEAELLLEEGQHEYKFVVDGTWIADPDNPSRVSDGFGGYNSVIVVTCGETPTPTCGQILFRYAETAPVSEVLLSGSFNAWASTAASAGVLTDPDDDGTWELVQTLPAGRHTYKFVVDGVWTADPLATDSEPDGYGGVNSVVSVPDCPSPGGLVLASHHTDSVAGTFEARFTRDGGGAIELAGVSATLDGTPVPAGTLALDAAGTTLTLSIDGLARGIHDVRVTSGGRTQLLKVYIDVSTDWRDAVLYFAMTDRFANGDRTNDAPVADVDARVNYQGGDFRGLTETIADGYFDRLGVGALWVSWPIDNPDGYEDGSFVDQDGCNLDAKTAHSSPMRYTAYHGYWPRNLEDVEEHYGTLAELQTLVNTAHAHGIRILLDFTANHVHEDSALYQEHRDSGWFNQPARLCQDVGWDNEPKTCWFTSYLPDLNYTNADARKAILDSAIEWAKRVGADGFRFDAVKHLEMAFVQELRARTRELELTGVPFYVVGETFTGDAGLIRSFLGADKIHGQFDFPANLQIVKGFATYETGLDGMDGAVRSAKATYGSDALMSTFLGNHDVARFLSHAAGMISCGVWDVTSHIAQGWRHPPAAPSDEAPYRKLRLAFTYVLTIPGVPLVYYGDEFGMPGAGDPDNRRFMRFGSELSSHEAGTLAFMERLGQARAAHAALRTGSWPAPLWSEGDFLAYARVLPDEKAIVLLNRGGGTKSGQLTVGGAGLTDGARLVDVLGDGGERTVSGGKLDFSVPGLSAQIYVTR